MGRPLSLVVVMLSGACGVFGPEQVDVSGMLVDRSYRLVGCDGAPGPNGVQLRSIPCLTFGSASTSDYADSGRLVLSRDGTAHWVLGRTQNVNPCYLMGTSCVVK